MGVDYYRVLGVPPTATTVEIRTAYRCLAQRHHPDRGGDPERMKLINQAWEHLGRPERRSAYDRQFQSKQQPAQAARSYTRQPDYADLWEPQGTWWDEAAYRRRETQRRTATSTAKPPRPAPWKDWVANAVSIMALILYIRWVQGTWQSDTTWRWWILLVTTGPFWGMAVLVRMMVRSILA